ncbi:MAG: glycosyltransferase, partial [Gemmatimonadota bacterium]|nr:glycosyltransferase [Gemmatimonadota bacterium]
MSRPRILLAGGGTGGHLYPALNIAAALRRVEPSAVCSFLGSRRGVEARVLPESDYAYRLLPLQPLYRHRPWRNWRLLVSAPAVVAGVRGAFRDFRPSIVVGTGGYVSGPALAWARIRGIPTAIQEQNAAPGLVTRLLASRVDQIHLGYPEAAPPRNAGAAAGVYTLGKTVAGGGETEDVAGGIPRPE